MIPAVVLSSHLMGYGVIRALGKRNVPVITVYYENKDMGYTSKYVYKKYQAPHPERNDKEFLKVLLTIYKEHGRTVLIPADDATLSFAAINIEILKKYFITAFNKYSTTKFFIEKKFTYKIAQRLNINIPQTYYLSDMSGLNSVEMSYPVLVKPVKSHAYYETFGKKMEVVNDRAGLEKALKLAFTFHQEVMIQEIIPGNETDSINYNSLFLNKKILVDFHAQKIRYTPNCYGVPCSTKSIDRIEGLKEICEPLLQKMNFSGYSCIEFKKDSRTGRYVLLEINGRFNRSIVHALGSGINFPYLYYDFLTTGNIPQTNIDYVKDFYWVDESHDPLICYKKFKETKNREDLFSPYTHNHIYANFDADDLEPFFKRVKDAFSLIIHNP